MTLVRINDLARELEVKSKSILDALPLVGVLEKKTHSSSLEEQDAEKVRAYLQRQGFTAVGSIRESNLGEQEIETRIDLSHIGRLGEVLKAIPQQPSPRSIVPQTGPRPVYKAPAPRPPVVTAPPKEPPLPGPIRRRHSALGWCN
jgi:translation initiation factor IF-2